jgi:hypothetical protein
MVTVAFGLQILERERRHCPPKPWRRWMIMMIMIITYLNHQSNLRSPLFRPIPQMRCFSRSSPPKHFFNRMDIVPRRSDIKIFAAEDLLRHQFWKKNYPIHMNQYYLSCIIIPQAAGYIKFLFDHPYPESPVSNLTLLERLYILSQYFPLKLGGQLMAHLIEEARQAPAVRYLAECMEGERPRLCIL